MIRMVRWAGATIAAIADADASDRGRGMREILSKSDNERAGVFSTVMSFLSLYRDPDCRGQYRILGIQDQ